VEVKYFFHTRATLRSFIVVTLSLRSVVADTLPANQGYAPMWGAS